MTAPLWEIYVRSPVSHGGEGGTKIIKDAGGNFPVLSSVYAMSNPVQN